MSVHPLVGNWVLDSIQFEDAATRERFDMYGSSPRGNILITAEGYAFVLIADSTLGFSKGQEDYARLFKGTMSYCGPYRLTGNRFITHVENAWHPAWIGTDQERFFDISGNTLTITTVEQSHPNYPGRTGRGLVKWHRAN
jgi:hypothetical protein